MFALHGDTRSEFSMNMLAEQIDMHGPLIRSLTIETANSPHSDPGYTPDYESLVNLEYVRLKNLEYVQLKTTDDTRCNARPAMKLISEILTASGASKLQTVCIDAPAITVQTALVKLLPVLRAARLKLFGHVPRAVMCAIGPNVTHLCLQKTSPGTYFPAALQSQLKVLCLMDIPSAIHPNTQRITNGFALDTLVVANLCECNLDRTQLLALTEFKTTQLVVDTGITQFAGLPAPHPRLGFMHTSDLCVWDSKSVIDAYVIVQWFPNLKVLHVKPGARIEHEQTLHDVGVDVRRDAASVEAYFFLMDKTR